jgi:hypothetical protein
MVQQSVSINACMEIQGVRFPAGHKSETMFQKAYTCETDLFRVVA